MDQQAIVQAKLSSGENAIAVHEASLMQGWVRTSRVLALAEHDSNHALFVFLSSRMPPQLFSDLAIERVLPIDADFRCEIDTDSKHQDGVGDVYVNISSRKLKLLFEMVPCLKTSNFVGEIFRAIEVFTKRRGPPPEFQWLHKYLTGAGGQRNSGGSWSGMENPSSDSTEPGVDGLSVQDDSLTDALLESPEISVPRQSIAKGATPIAARESVIKYQMAMKEQHYTYTQVLRVYVGTWNVNGQPPTVNLSDWLAQDPEPPDIYAIGFQELDLSKEAFLFNDTPREEEWQEAVLNGLHKKARYHKVALVRLVGMMLLIFVQEQHAAYVRGVATETVGTGIMGKMGNKGGVGVRFELHNTSLCFVNSHLAAHVEDHIYWLGDLNYRITELEPKIVKDYIDHRNFQPLLDCDQLHQQHGAKNVFAGEKNRAPAWCDRVLWKGDGITQVAYRSHPELRISDHKPVSSLFDSQIRVIDTAKYRKIHEEVMKKLDKLENEFLPQVMVDNTEVIFDTIHYLESQTRDLIIANTGQVPVTFEFINKLDDSNFCKDWLNIEPYCGFIMPGEKCDVKLEVFVDKKSAFKLNSGEDKLYDILVLHLEGGKDIFITVTGTYERSCFGSSIEALVYISVPVREIPVGRLMELIVMQLPEHRKNVFLYLCAFLQEVLCHVSENGLDTKTVATLFGTIFLRDPPRSRGDQSSRGRTNQQTLDRKKANFVYHFLVNDQSDFILGR
ncbi:Inositol polyphosphate 5-phosphatase OCRL-1 [Blattella germanica]|nr:Inositol polyphosphate 5-phosphatase OCRL-1 [Blattella germanica]